MSSILAWNCRGAGGPKFRRALRDLINQHHPDILFLCETRVHSDQGNWILHNFQFTQFAVVETRGFAGGLWCLWNENKVMVKIWDYTAQMVTLGILYEGRTSWLLSLVYVSPVVVIRDAFYDYLEELSKCVRFPWVLIGDFNQVIRPEDKKGGQRVAGYSVERMRKVMEVGCFRDVKFFGTRFTWSNKHLGRSKILQRLDQRWGNLAWHSIFPRASVRHLARIHSDHCPVLLNLGATEPEITTSKGFRFQNHWMEHKDFRDFVKSAWPTIPDNLPLAITIFWDRLRVWSREVYGSLFQNKKRCEARLVGIQKALEDRPSRFLARLETQVIGEYGEILRHEETFWQQKARLNWLAKGERNSNFFHKSIRTTRQKSKCTALKDSNGHWIEDDGELKNMVRQYYM